VKTHLKEMQYNLIVTLLFLFTISCKHQPKKEKKTHKYTNQLIHETSPYLLQHAHNPVNWYAWNDETLALAKKENKLILLSIGYAACHWCHVMEHESFENDTVAKIMNENFINIKIDREERPDIDQLYMTAVQLLTQSGGWPLNCIALPNGKPFWGGTYFPKNEWINNLTQIAVLYKKDPQKIIQYAENLTKGIKDAEIISLNTKTSHYSKDTIEHTVITWSEQFDRELGGAKRAPKFPMPNNYQFLLRYATQTNNSELKKHVYTTLNKMALGGVFDQVGGGFSRYSTDEYWHIPHFEKMLYDNAQLVSLYADAYLISKNKLYKEIVYRTLDFIERELTHENGAFYSSLDADSNNQLNELEEGAYYAWTKKDLKAIIGNDYNLFSEYYNINTYGFWEKDKYHLIKNLDNPTFSSTHNIALKELDQKVLNWQKKLLQERSKRERPRLDDKSLTSWNALMLKGYIDAYRVFNEPHFLEIALKNANFIKNKQLREDGGLNHNYKNGTSNINGYLEDYATVIEAYIALYETTLDENWLNISKNLTDYCFKHFYNSDIKMFYFTSDKDRNLIARKMEITDNVIPASNSILANCLFKLGRYFENNHFKNISKQMLNNVVNDMSAYPSGYSNWLQLYSNLTTNFYEIAVIGKEANKKIKELNQFYIPNKIIAGSVVESQAPLLKNRFSETETLLYICIEGTCKLPVSSVKKARNQIKSNY
jgi:uncharacterized protein YyaL (SSP411 family)